MSGEVPSRSLVQLRAVIIAALRAVLDAELPEGEVAGGSVVSDAPPVLAQLGAAVDLPYQVAVELRTHRCKPWGRGQQGGPMRAVTGVRCVGLVRSTAPDGDVETPYVAALALLERMRDAIELSQDIARAAGFVGEVTALGLDDWHVVELTFDCDHDTPAATA